MGKNNVLDDQYCSDQNVYIPGVSISCVAFCFDAGSLKLLLCKPESREEWVLPEGWVAKDEDVDDAVRRILKSKIGVKNPYINKFHFFGNKERMDIVGMETADGFISARLINLAYYAFVKAEDVKIPRSNSDEVRWFRIGDCSSIHADHLEVIDTCLRTIRRQIGFLPIGYGLLSEKFTMPELRTIYETILNRSIDRRNFQRKMLSIGYVKPLNETRKIGGHKSPNLYKFDKKKYEEAAKLGIQLMSNNL